MSMQAKHLYNIVFCCLLLLDISSCREDDDPASQLHQRFEDAEILNVSWCLNAQLELALLDGTEWTVDKIDVTNVTVESEVSNLKSSTNASSDRPIKIISFVDKMTNSIETQAQQTIGKIIWCKLRSQDGIERGLGVDIPGTEGTCRQMNEQALTWALEQLTDQEKNRYLSEGKKLEFTEDIMANVGGEWYGTNCGFSLSEDKYLMASSALLVPYDDYPDLEEELKGVHYCKLLAPSQALFWVLHRAFWDNPLGTGPQEEAEVALQEQGEGCQVTTASSPGSCIFLFSTSNQHFCEEYTGTSWEVATAESKCTGREGVFSTDSCTDRNDETSTIDGDGTYKGVCIINCGNNGEYRWHVYSEPEGMTFEQACPDWFPLE